MAARVSLSRHRPALALVWFGLSLLAACGGTQKIRGYSAAAPPPEHVATLRTDGWSGERTEVERIDGVPVRENAPAFGNQEIELPAGMHTLEVSCPGSTRNFALSFDARPGGQYELQSTRVKDGFWSELWLHYAGGSSRWVAWIVDTRTGDVVAGFRPEDGLFSTDMTQGKKAPETSKIIPVQQQQQHQQQTPPPQE